MNENKIIYDLIIIGGGPAGITAGIYGARQKLNTLLITKSFGGQVARKAVAIENYPGLEEISGLELIKKFEKHLRKQKIDIERDEVVKLKKIGRKFLALTKSKNRFEARAVIIATGADPRPLKVPGEKKFIGRGVSYCAVCDQSLFGDKTIAVIGGGNAGFEAAISLTNYAKKIYILEYGEKVGADEINQERVKKTGKVEIIANAVLKQIKGNQFVNSIIYQDRKTKKEIKLPVDGIFVEIGSQPATSFVKGLVDFNEKDEIKINPRTNQTKIPGLFAAGDITEIKDKQIVIAAGEGAKAALSVYGYLQSRK
ncbi:MAG: FAD-dependent oxidoreductase [Candidatus Nealsonbacteria bacterium]|nr:FAD-dependent oxidoreductase [Candidatus Nealsonbacteria bacterium]